MMSDAEYIAALEARIRELQGDLPLPTKERGPLRGICGQESHPLGGPCTYEAGHGGVHSS